MKWRRNQACENSHNDLRRSHEQGTRSGWHTQRRIHSDVGRQARRSGKSAVRISPAGRCITSRDRRLIRIASTRRRPAAGSARSSSAPTTAARPGRRPEATSSRRAAGARPAQGESNKFVYDTSPETGKPLTTHQWYDGTQHPWEFKRVWHLGTFADRSGHGLRRRGRCRALFRSTDGGENWQELPGLRGHGTGPKWQPGAGGMCLHTIILDPSNPKRIFIAISAAGAFRTDDGGKTWKPINRGLRSQYIPDPNAEVGHCVHHIAMHPSRPGVLFMQKHWDVMRSDNAGDSLAGGERESADRFRIRDRRTRARAGDDLRRPHQERWRALPARRQAARLPQPNRRKRVGGADQGPAAEQIAT